jgi:archaellum component FlaC
MLASIDSYKETFTDVKIIYNIQEKMKRYTICENNYKALQEELDNIEQKVAQLSEEKVEIIEAYKDIDKEFTLTLKAIGSKLIAMSRSFMADFCEM